MQRILDRYIFSELFPPFLLAIGGLLLILLSRVLLHLLEMWVEAGVGLFSILKVLARLLPSFLILTLPIAGIMASITVFSRLSREKELLAMSGAGLSLYRISRPVLFFSCLVFGATFFLANLGQSWTVTSIKSLAFEFFRDQWTLPLEPGVFNRSVPGVVFYLFTNETEPDPNYRIFISDNREESKPQLIVARDFVLELDRRESQFVLRLYNGTLHLEPKMEKYEQIRFATYDVKLPFDPRLYEPSRELPTKKELIARLNSTNWRDAGALLQLADSYKKLAVPIEAFLLGIIGVPLGIVTKRSGRIGGFAVGIAVVTLYFLFDIMGEYLVMSFFLHPFAGVWMANLTILMLGGCLFYRVNRRNFG